MVHCVIVLCLSLAACSNPTVNSESYSTGEVLMSTKSAFLVIVDVECDGSDVRTHY